MRWNEYSKLIKYFNQATQEVVSRVPESTQEEMKEAVESAQHAFKEWSQTSVPTRCRIMFRLRDLIEKHTVYQFF